MGWASERSIEMHNENMQDENYAEEYFQQCAAEEQRQFEFFLMLEKFEDFFEEYKLAHDGYEEIQMPVVQEVDFDDIPF